MRELAGIRRRCSAEAGAARRCSRAGERPSSPRTSRSSSASRRARDRADRSPGRSASSWRGRRRRSVVVFDDIHWAEPTLLDLLAALPSDRRRLLLALPGPAGAARGAPRLARAAAARAACARGGRRAARRLGAPAALRGGSRQARREPAVRRGARREVLALSRRGRDLERAAHDLNALLGARLDQLDRRASRARARRGRGRDLPPRCRRRALDPAASPVPARLAALVAHGPDPAGTATLRRESDASASSTSSFRDAAYEATAKKLRADLHEQFADWLERRRRPVAEYDEILGYHLEQALPLPGRARPGRRRDPRARRTRGRTPRRRRLSGSVREATSQAAASLLGSGCCPSPDREPRDGSRSSSRSSSPSPHS